MHTTSKGASCRARFTSPTKSVRPCSTSRPTAATKCASGSASRPSEQRAIGKISLRLRRESVEGRLELGQGVAVPLGARGFEAGGEPCARVVRSTHRLEHLAAHQVHRDILLGPGPPPHPNCRGLTVTIQASKI